MQLPSNPWLWIAAGYLLAAIPVGYLVGRARGLDLREHGSGNIGATNAVRLLGAPLGALVLLFDVAKAAVPMYLAAGHQALLDTTPQDWPPETWPALVGLACICGHVFPIYLRFRGGKGVACALGILGVLSWPATLAALLLYAQTMLLVRVSAVASLTAIGVGAAVVLAEAGPVPYRVLVVLTALLIWLRHRENLRALPQKLIDSGQRSKTKRASKQSSS